MGHQANLVDIGNLWIFMYENGCRADRLQPQHLMSGTVGSKKVWRVFNFEGVSREDPETHDKPGGGKFAHPIVCHPEVVHRIMSKDHSYCKLRMEQTLGTL